MRTVLIVATLGLLPLASHAQEGGAACPSIENDHDRLACYDRAMRGAPHAPAPAQASPAPTAAPAPTQASPAPAPATAQASPPPAPAPAPAPASSAAAAVVGGAAAATHPAAPATTSPATISTAPHNARNTTAATPPQPGAPPTFDPVTGAPTTVVPVVVLSALSRPGFATEFHTDQGGVWVQTEAKPLTLPKTPFNAELQPGKFGSTFLVVPDRKLGIRVRPPGK